MIKIALGPVAILTAALALPAIALAQEEPAHSDSEALVQQETPAPSPNQIVAEAAAEEWVSIPSEDLLVMTLAPDAAGNAREIIIQLMPEPFSQGWVHNIKLLAREGWYDGISVNRVQDNYVVQWGDPNYDNPEAEGEAKPLPEGLKVMREGEYTTPVNWRSFDEEIGHTYWQIPRVSLIAGHSDITPVSVSSNSNRYEGYQAMTGFVDGWQVAGSFERYPRPKSSEAWPVHCYGMVGVGRGYSPDTGSGAELYTVIGHAPRHLDRNIALVGRIIEGMEHLSSLPRGHGVLGFYAEDEFEKRTPILSIDVASDVEGADYSFEYLSTEGETFARYAEARANRRDPFFIVPAGGADICNIPVPVRRVSAGD